MENGPTVTETVATSVLIGAKRASFKPDMTLMAAITRQSMDLQVPLIMKPPMPGKITGRGRLIFTRMDLSVIQASSP